MLDVALKEWAVVCDLLLEGKLALLLRKGGIAEKGGAGVFELEHPRFAMWPSWAHQIPQRIKEPFRDQVQVLDEPGEVTLCGYGQVDHIWQVPSREAFDQLEDLHCWTEPQINMRFNYKPEKPLYLMAVRAYKLAQTKEVENLPEYSGCRSWVPLHDTDAVDEAGAVAALDDSHFAVIVARVNQAFKSGS